MPRAALATPDRLDPADAWRPWEPTPADPWGLKWAGHLYRRAGFGATRAELREAVRRGPAATLDLLMAGEPGHDERDRLLEATGASIARQGEPGPLRGWWLYAILYGGHPLREKLTLFWHNHFATSVAKVQRPALMYEQNQLLRRHALGKFRPLVTAVGHDPAMLIWLDSNSNVRGKPNENYARELMELFTLGVGHYTEKDVREAARAFTGWQVEDDRFEFDAELHDDGPKTVLGRTGKWSGDDIVGILLDQPAAARFLVGKLYRYLVSEATAPPAALLEPLAERFRKSDYDVGALVRTILASRHFYSAHAYRRRVKGPVEFAVGAVRATWDGPVAPTQLVSHLEAMGQELFAPPNVKGWAGGKSWLNTATVVARHRFAQGIARGSLQQGSRTQAVPFAVAPAPEGAPTPPGEPRDPDASADVAVLVHREKLTDPARIVALLADVLLDGELGPRARARLVAFMADGKPTGKALDRRVREAAHALMTMPEYQLA